MGLHSSFAPRRQALKRLGGTAGRPAEGILRELPRPPDLADRGEGRLPYNVATDVLATIECVLEDELRPAIVSLQRAAQMTDAELERDFLEWKTRWRL
jgi:hypothetical protein